MAQHSIAVEQSTSATVEQVWVVLTDLESSASVISGIQHIEVLTEGPYAVGTKWRETRTMMGRAETQQMQVAEVDPPHRTVLTAHAGGVDYTTEITVRAQDSGSLIRMEFSGEQSTSGFVTKVTWLVFGWVGSLVTKRVMASDLRDIAAAAERP